MTLHEAPSSGNVDQGPFSPAQADEDVQSGKQDRNASSNEADVACASLSRLERLPTEILTTIVSYDHLTWHDLHCCSRVSRRLREVALPERGTAPPAIAELEYDAQHSYWTIETRATTSFLAKARRKAQVAQKVRRLEVSRSPVKGWKWDTLRRLMPSYNLAEDDEDDEDNEDDKWLQREEYADGLLCDYSIGEDEIDYLPGILSTFRHVLSLRLAGSSYFSDESMVDDLKECLPDLREFEGVVPTTVRRHYDSDYDSDYGEDYGEDDTAEKEADTARLVKAFREKGIRFIPL